MDSFTYIVPTKVPTDNGGYCVAAHTSTVDVPADAEGGGSTANAYCVVA